MMTYIDNSSSIEASKYEMMTDISSIVCPVANTIGNAAFKACSELTKVNAPNVSRIDSNAFNNC